MPFLSVVGVIALGWIGTNVAVGAIVRTVIRHQEKKANKPKSAQSRADKVWRRNPNKDKE